MSWSRVDDECLLVGLLIIGTCDARNAGMNVICTLKLLSCWINTGL